MTKKIDTFTVNVASLATGLWGMIQAHPDGYACIGFGMFPADVMDVFDRGLKEKIPNEYVTGCGSGNRKEHNDGEQIRSNIHREVSCAILCIAREAGVLKV